LYICTLLAPAFETKDVRIGRKAVTELRSVDGERESGDAGHGTHAWILSLNNLKPLICIREFANDDATPNRVSATKTVLAQVEIAEGTKGECVSFLFLVLAQDHSSSLDHHTRFRGNNIKQNIPLQDPRKQEQGRKTRNFLGGNAPRLLAQQNR
jgi:hypothetical protein